MSTNDDLLHLARTAGWPQVRIRDGEIIRGTESAWRAFLNEASEWERIILTEFLRDRVESAVNN